MYISTEIKTTCTNYHDLHIILKNIPSHILMRSDGRSWLTVIDPFVMSL